jgi:hypothetical protein
MNDSNGIPAPPPDRDLPNHRRLREEVLMRTGPDDRRAHSARRRWGLPLGIAAGVAAVSVAAVAVTGGHGGAEPVRAAPPLSGGSPTSTAPGGAGSASASAHVTSAPGTFTVTSERTTPIDAGTVGRILASCLGADASRYHAVIAVRTPVASRDWDGAVIAVDSGGQYVQCETKGHQGTSQDVPPTFINDRLWSPGHVVEFFDSLGAPAGQGQSVLRGAGHYTSDVAELTVSYGDDPTQYPAIMAGGAFFYTAAVSTGTTGSAPPLRSPDPRVHAYDASGKEIYHQ